MCRSSGPCTYATIRSDKHSAILGDFGVVTVALPYSLALGTVALAGTLGYLPPEFTDGKHGLRSDMNIQLWSGKFLLCALNKSHTGITLISTSKVFFGDTHTHWLKAFSRLVVYYSTVKEDENL